MREIEWKLLSELMKNSRRSDRELAKAIGSSQPTVSRTRKRLEEKGYIREYTMIPDFAKLGFELMALTFSSFGSPLGKEEAKQMKEIYRNKTEEEREARETIKLQVIMQEKGNGLGYDGVTISFHEDYESLMEFMKQSDQHPHVKLKNSAEPQPILEIDKIESFIINLKDEARYVPLTLANLSKHLVQSKGKKEWNKAME